MDNRRLILAVMLAILLVFLWQPMMVRIGRMMGYDLTAPPATQPAADSNVNPAPTPPTPVVPAPSTQSTTQSSTTQNTLTPGVWQVVEPSVDKPAPIAPLGSAQLKDPNFNLQLETAALGAGVNSVTLNQFTETIYDGKQPYHYQETTSPTYADESRSLTTRKILLPKKDNPTNPDDWAELNLSNVVWKSVDPIAPATVIRNGKVQTYRIDLSDGARRIELFKTYVVYPNDILESPDLKDKKDSSGGYEVHVLYTLRTRETISGVKLVFNGPLPPPSESERIGDSFFMTGFLTGERFDKTVHPVANVGKDTVNLIKPDHDGQRAIWIAATTTYFNAIVRPLSMNGDESKSSDWWDKAEAIALNPNAPPAERVVSVAITTKALTLSPGDTNLNMRVFFGPRKRELLDNAYYSASNLNYGQSLVIATGPCWFCTFDWLISTLYWVLSIFRFLVKDWGLAIIMLVAVVRLLLHPVARFSQLQMLKMGEMAPELQRLEKKFGKTTPEYKQAASELMMKQGATPIFGCLPMFLQMPIWIALWSAMNSTFDLRHEPFFYGLTWIRDLSKPDHLIDFNWFHWKPITLQIPCCFLPISISGLNVLPVIFGVLQFISFKTQPKPTVMTAEQEQQQKMTQWMILGIMPVMMYAQPSGLMIYMITSFMVGIIESRRIRAEYKVRRAEAEKFKTAEGQSLVGDKPGKKKGWLASRMEDLQKRAEDMQKQMEKTRQEQERQKRGRRND